MFLRTTLALWILNARNKILSKGLIKFKTVSGSGSHELHSALLLVIIKSKYCTLALVASNHYQYEHPSSFACCPQVVLPDGIVWKNASFLESIIHLKSLWLNAQSVTFILWSCVIQSQLTLEFHHILTFQTKQTLRRVPIPSRFKHQSPMETVW